MKDSQETNLPMEGKLEEAKMPVTTPENTAEEIVINTTNAESTTEETANPVTGDSVIKYIITLILSMVSVVSGGLYFKKKTCKSN